jgi:hypothetical protein
MAGNMLSMEIGKLLLINHLESAGGISSERNTQ